MKNYIRHSAVLGLMILGCAIVGHGQTVQRLVADIPFDFYVRGEKLSAGRYAFEPASRGTYPAPLVVRSLDPVSNRSIMAPVLAHSSSDGDKYLLIFNRYGSFHYLSSVNAGSGPLAVKLMKSPGERKLARELHRAVPVEIRPLTSAGK